MDEMIIFDLPMFLINCRNFLFLFFFCLLIKRKAITRYRPNLKFLHAVGREDDLGLRVQPKFLAFFIFYFYVSNFQTFFLGENFRKSWMFLYKIKNDNNSNNSNNINNNWSFVLFYFWVLRLSNKIK